MATDRTTREWSEKFTEPGIRINIKLSAPSEIDLQPYAEGVKKLLRFLENPNQIVMDLTGD